MDNLKDESKLLKQLVDTLLYCGDTHIHTLLNLICNSTSLSELKSYSKAQLRRADLTKVTYVYHAHRILINLTIY